jgi:hypothetical protein
MLQKRSTSDLHLLLDVFIHRGGVHGQWARSCGALLARAREVLEYRTLNRSSSEDRADIERKLVLTTMHICSAACKFALYQYSSVYICSVQLCIHYLPNIGIDVCTFARYSCVYNCPGIVA